MARRRAESPQTEFVETHPLGEVRDAVDVATHEREVTTVSTQAIRAESATTEQSPIEIGSGLRYLFAFIGSRRHARRGEVSMAIEPTEINENGSNGETEALSADVQQLVEEAIREGYPEVKEFAQRAAAAGFRVYRDDRLGFRPDESFGGDIPLRGEGTNAVRAARIISNAMRGRPLDAGLDQEKKRR